MSFAFSYSFVGVLSEIYLAKNNEKLFDSMMQIQHPMGS